MSKGAHLMVAGRLLLILAVLAMMAVRPVRPDDDATLTSSSEDLDATRASQQLQDDSNLYPYLEAAIRNLKAVKRNRLIIPTTSSSGPAKRLESELIGGRNGAAASLYRRSALNKNFIRFGRSGFPNPLLSLKNM